MKIFTCSVAQNGFFAGPVHFIHSNFSDKGKKTDDTETELNRFHAALVQFQERIRSIEKSSTEDLNTLKNPESGNRQNTEIWKTVQSILSDEAFLLKVEQGIREQRMSASAAIQNTADDFAKRFGQMNSDYLRSRQDDIRGAANELIAVLNGKSHAPQELSAFAAIEISPAELVSADETLIGGLLTEKGSGNSHAAILAGNLGIPYLYGNREAVTEAENAKFIILDSEAGTVTIDPNLETRKAAEARMAEVISQQAKQASKIAFEEIPDCRTKIFANIAGPGDINALLKSGADGVGLFRTEFLFMGRNTAPGEDEQYEAYKAVLDAMGQKPVIIRTMDIGSDKKVPWLSLGEESNSALGLRGVRVSLERDELFHTQIRALLRAGVSGNLKVMFPMVASAWEIDEIMKKVRSAAQELEDEDIPFKNFEIGVMIETPAAAVCAEELAKKVSFFSIGTNDLTQYTLAIDREARGLDRYFNPHHEAVFKLIEMTVSGGHKHGVKIGICGQLGADPEAVERLIEIGVDELSVPVSKVSQTKMLAYKAEVSQIKTALKKEEGPADREVAAAADGELVPMNEIPDEAFSSGSLGACFGIIPSNGKIYAPISGMVSSIAESRHAVKITADDGRAILVHVGINTVKLRGKPFRLHVCQGARVERDQLIMEADLEAIKQAGLSSMVIVAELKS